MNRVKKKALPGRKKKSVGGFVKSKKTTAKDSDNDSMVDNGTDEDDDEQDAGGIVGASNGRHGSDDDPDSPDSGMECGAFVRSAKGKTPSNGVRATTTKKAGKRKADTTADEEEAHRVRVKAIKALYKPPTVEEINRLKETENYYHSNLFRMQTEQMLKEVRVPSKTGRFVQVWLEELKEVLRSIEGTTTGDRGILEVDYDGIDFPLEPAEGTELRETLAKDRFHFELQNNVRIIGGSGVLRTTFGKPLIVDLLVTIPDACFHKDDYLNLRYHYKRAHYLCTVAEHLLQLRTLVAEARFVPLKGDRLKPLLELVPADESFSHKVHFQLHAVPEGGKFPKKRFLPENNNVRPALIGQTVTAEELASFPTPHYNASILYDLRLAKNAELLESTIQSDGLREAIVLLKVWARQRHFDRGRYAFDGGLITFYIAHLLQNKRIYPNMSSYQIIRLFWNQLTATTWDTVGQSFDGQISRESIATFHRFYDVVFLDPLGVLNLTANLPLDLYRRVKQESALAIRLLDNRKINCFLPLFLASYPAFVQYDHLVSLQEAEVVAATIESFAEEIDRLDYLGDREALFTKMVEKLLRKGLGSRVTCLVPLARTSEHPHGCTIGLCLNPAEAFEVIDKGPEAVDTVASEAFRSFWRGKAELRRFKDGSITESCVWGQASDPIGQKRLTVRSIVLFLLQAHYDIPVKQINYLASQFETALQPWPPKEIEVLHETIEERSLAIIRAFDALGRMMRDLDKLPLTINAIVGTDAVFRYSDPDPPRPTASGLLVNGQLVFLSGKPIHATIQLAASGKWPDQLEAIRRLKAAFYLRIADCIGEVPGPTARKPVAQAYGEYLDVLYEKFLFRFVIIHQREISILREYLAENKVTRLLRDTDESVALEMQATILPKLGGILHGLHQQYFSFGSVASIAKRWLYAQLIDPYHWPDECTELLLASLYLNQPLQAPVQPQAGFLRWLQFVATTDWSKEMIVVNFNDELSSETIDELEREFGEHRERFPPLTIVTPFDGTGRYGLFGRRAPSVPVLNRVSLLAKVAIEMIEQNFRTIRRKLKSFFQPSYEGYDVIIHLDSTIVPAIGIRHSEHIGDRTPPSLFVKPADKEPAAGFDPVRFYLRELREAYRQFALFFHDPCGGDRIAVLWRPDALEEKPFTMSNINGRMLSSTKGEGTLRLNVDALVRDFEIIGKGLVKSIERR
ncbi:nucleolar protein 6-like [Anopheles aquasalis]|uniref:nucleolar protein 6-like n=1 Tax=Anopheles aquasalis TaxID=42839 RepID=UPI00215AB872|nr:nucleolar protein 6-like [Anopheles aquasalis]